jgi:predicted MFS family arabinose efflux permease
LKRLPAQIGAFVGIRTVLNTSIRLVYPFLTVFARGLGVDLPALSIAVSLRAAAGVFAPFLASVADSRGRRAGMLLGLLIYTVGCSLVVFWPVYWAFLLALVLTLVGNDVFIPSMQAYLGDRIPYQRRGFVLGLTEIGWSLAFIIGVPLMGYLIAHWGWQAPFPVLAALGLVSILLLLYLLPKNVPVQAGRPSLWSNLGRVFSYAPALVGLLLGVTMSMANETVNLVFGVWLEDSFGLKIAALGLVAAVIGVAELTAELLVTGLVDRLGKFRAVTLGLLANCLAVMGMFWLGGSRLGATLALFCFYLTFEWSIVSVIPIMTEVLPGARATFMATNIAAFSLGRALGAAIALPVYNLGSALSLPSPILASAMVAVGLNAIALLGLRYLRRRMVGLR